MDLFLNISIFLIIIISILIIYFFIYTLYVLYLKYKIKEAQDKVKKNCKLARWGCCKDKLTPKLDIDGSNCRGF